MIINNINPDIITIAGHPIRFYGIVYVIGYLVSIHVLQRKKIHNLTKDKATDLATFVLIAGLIGARIFHVLTDLPYYSLNPLKILFIWEGGVAYQGGLVFALAAAYYYTKKHNISFLRVADTVLLIMPLIVGLGRIANYFNSEHDGPPTNLPWCVVFQRVDDVCRHPTQIYQAIAEFAVFGALLAISRMKLKKGTITFSYLIGYGLIRLFTDFLRIHELYFLGLSHTQWFSLALIAAGIFGLIRQRSTAEQSP